MSDPREFPDEQELTRQPGRVSQGGDEQISPEEALAEAQARLANLEAERAASIERERQSAQRAQQAEKQALDSHGTAMSAHAQSLETGIAAQTALADQAEQALATAYAAGDPAGIARAQRQLTEATTQLSTLNQQKTYFNQELERQKTEQEQRPTQQQQQQTRGVRVVTPGGEMEVMPSDKEWMDRHPRFYNDNDYYNHSLTAHQRIARDGITPGSPAYYRELDSAMGRYEAFEAHEQGGEVAVPQQNLTQRQQMRRQPASSMAAPVSRASAPRQPSNGVMSWQQVSQHLGGGITEAELREYARVNGYRGEEGFQRYLAAQSEIAALERSGGETGLKTDATYR